MAVLVPMVAQAKAPTGLEPVPLVPSPTGHVSRAEWQRWYLPKVNGGAVFRAQEKSEPALEEACTSAVEPFTRLTEVAQTDRAFSTELWEPMAIWGRGLRARAGSYHSAKQRRLVSSASKEISSGAHYLAVAYDDFAEIYDGIAGMTCNQKTKRFFAEKEYGAGFPKLSKGFVELLDAR